MLGTPRLWLVPISEPLLMALLTGRPLSVNNEPIIVPADWTNLWTDHPGALAYTLQALKNDSTLYASGWWGYPVRQVIAHTLAADNHSSQLLKKLGF